jgi:hypothetical protein
MKKTCQSIPLSTLVSLNILIKINAAKTDIRKKQALKLDKAPKISYTSVFIPAKKLFL